MAVRITCINKEGGYHYDPHHAISQLGWKNEQDGSTGKNSRQEIYDWIKNKGGVAYVLDRLGNRVNLVTRVSATRTLYIQTVADGIPTDNLLALPECV